jgi:Spy/CpxP family protein refolding chaperone
MRAFLKPVVSVLAIASLLVAGSAFAQYQKSEKGWPDKDWHKGPPSTEEKLARISQALELSDEQSAEMLALLQEQEIARQALHERTMALMGDEICAQKNQAEEAILAILEPEQVELFQQMKDDRLARANSRVRSRKGTEPLDCAGYGGDDS